MSRDNLIGTKKNGFKSEADIRKKIQKLELKDARLEMDNIKLRKSLQKSQSIYNQLPVLTALINHERKFVNCNSAFCRFLGYSEDELKGKSISFITYPEDLESGMKDLVDEKTKSISLKKRFVRKDGHLVWGEISICLIRDSNNKPIYYLPIIHDINNREHTEKKLKESEERYKRITNGLTDYMYTVIVKNGKAIKTLHNDACREVTGYTSRDFKKDPFLWINMVVPQEREMVADRFSSILSGEFLPTIEHRIIHKDGKIRWISDTAIPKYDSAGILISYDGIIKNISSGKLAETYGDISREVLKVLNETDDIRIILRNIVYILKIQTGLDAVGIRLKESEDFPYQTHDGFSNDFLLKENSLTGHTPDSRLCYDTKSNLCVECNYGLVLSGKTDPNNVNFTKGGSYWTNDESELHGKNAGLNPHPECSRHGFASMAIIPIRNKDIIVGLIHLYDRKKDGFTSEAIEILEAIASHIGIALMLKKSERQLIKLEEKFQKINSVNCLEKDYQFRE